MPNYKFCPSCGNSEPGTRIYRCTSCSTIYCRGCSSFSNDCPKCGSIKWNVLGDIPYS